MNQQIPKRHDPRQLGYRRRGFGIELVQARERFADDFELPFNTLPQQVVILVIIECFTGDKTPESIRSLHRIPQILAGLRPHRRSVPTQQDLRGNKDCSPMWR